MSHHIGGDSLHLKSSLIRGLIICDSCHLCNPTIIEYVTVGQWREVLLL